MSQERYPVVGRTGPHGEHTITLVSDDHNPESRVYNVCQKNPAGGTRRIVMLGSEIKSLGEWFAKQR